MSEQPGTSGVIRTITIMETLSRHQAINLESLSKETNLPKATLLRFLSTLVTLGYVYRDPHDLYSLTLKMFSVGSRGLEHLDLINLASPIAQNLCEELGETVHMGVLEEDSAVYVLKKESSYTIRMYSRVGKTIPLYCTAIGKILLADMDDEEISSYLDRTKLKAFTPNTFTTKEDLLSELNEVRKEDRAMDNEEHEMGTLCIGSPIRDHSGKVIAAMSVSWPLFRFEPEQAERMSQAIHEATDRISRLMGYTSR